MICVIALAPFVMYLPRLPERPVSTGFFKSFSSIPSALLSCSVILSFANGFLPLCLLVN